MEDDVALARLLQRRLERLGFSVDHAGDGEIGLRMCRENQYDLVIVDHKMPVYSGLEVIQALAEFESPPPTIMVTGAGMSELLFRRSNWEPMITLSKMPLPDISSSYPPWSTRYSEKYG